MAKKILIIDDDSSIRLLLKRTLQKGGYKVLEAENGREGLTILSREKDISLIFLDLIMPVLNGQEFLKRLRIEGINVPVVVVSTDDSQKEAAKILGIKDFITKPIFPSAVLDIVQKYAK